MPPPPTPLELPSSYHDLTFEQIRVSHHPASAKAPTPIIFVTLYRPKKYNAFTDHMMVEVERVFSLLSVDDRVKCIILTGHGKMFCAGADLDVGFGGRGIARAKDHRDGGGRLSLAIHHCTKPTIAALNGAAVGVGITMTLPCSIRIARASAKIGFVFGRRGLVMEAASSFFLPRILGYGRALRVCTTGEVARADSPLFEGLFSEVVEDESVDGAAVRKRAVEIAEMVCSEMSGVSAYLMREMMWRGSGWSAEEAHLLDSNVIYDLIGNGDNLEGVKAFREKRPVHFTGTMAKNAPACYPWWQQIDTAKHARAAEKSKL